MEPFADPRSEPRPDGRTHRSPTTDPQKLTELLELCREGRLYAVERWISNGRPLQLTREAARKQRRHTSALEIAVEAGSHALVLLLLCNGYDPTLELDTPLNLALRGRRWDLLELLLEWGADPHRVELEDLFGTYRSDLFERFRELGVDLTDGQAIAWTLAEHTSNKPLFGFARRHRTRDPKIQDELNMALAHHASEGNGKGVSLCLWAGADPHAPARSLQYGSDSDEEDGFFGYTAIEEACSHGDADIVKKLGPDPTLDDFDELYRAAETGAVVEVLAQFARPRDVNSVIQRRMLWLSFNFGHGRWRSLETLRRLFETGVRWSASRDEIANLRRPILKLPNTTFIDLMKLLAKEDYCSPEILHELGRTPAMRRRIKEVGFIPPDPEEETRRSRGSRPRARPTRSREVLRKFGVEAPKRAKGKQDSHAPRLERSVQIGSRRRGRREVRMTRHELFERVWSQPISAVAREWGLSDQGLRKACQRVQIPVPPRGYWAKLRAGRRVRKPRLPGLPKGQAEEVVVWVPE